MPRPRKLRAASTTMADATSSDVCTMIGAVTFGQMWRSMMRPDPAPSARAAMTKSRSRTERVCPRTSRAKIGVNTTPMASMALVRPGPRLAAMARASTKVGNDHRASTRSTSTSSIQPPWYPASSPMDTPARSANPTETTPACTDVRVPWMMRLSTSRPSWSVPSQ